MKENLPPQNIEAETAILGGLLVDRGAWDEIADLVVAEDFYKPAHQKVFSAIARLHQQQAPVDIITLTNELKKTNELELVGGANYLLEIINHTISATNLTSYAKIVREKSVSRKIIKTCSWIIEDAFAQNYENFEGFMDSVESRIFILNETKQVTGLVGAEEIVKNSIARLEDLYNKKADITGLATGFRDLDKMTAGLHPGELTIIAARPSMGKTAFSLNIAQHISLQLKKTVAYFSVEMSRESVMMRMLASVSRTSGSEIRTGRISDQNWPQVISAAGLLSESPIFIDDTSGISPFEIRARCRRLKSKTGSLDLIMIDYLQLMELKQKVESRERAVSEISKLLKSIARELQIPVIALAQLNRGVEGRSDRRPMLSDLRESGSIEQDADLIMMLYRDDYYEKDDPEKAGRAEVIIGKQRNGPTGKVDLRWDSRIGRFLNLDLEGPSPGPKGPLPSQQPQNYGANRGKPKNFATSV